MIQFADIAAFALKNAQLFEKSQQEIRDRQQAERTQSQNERKYRTLMENLGEGVCLIASSGHFKFINPAAIKIFGISHDKLINYSIKQFLPEDQKKYFQEAIIFVPGTENNEFELRIRNACNGNS